MFYSLKYPILGQFPNRTTSAVVYILAWLRQPMQCAIVFRANCGVIGRKLLQLGCGQSQSGLPESTHILSCYHSTRYLTMAFSNNLTFNQVNCPSFLCTIDKYREFTDDLWYLLMIQFHLVKGVVDLTVSMEI